MLSELTFPPLANLKRKAMDISLPLESFKKLKPPTSPTEEIIAYAPVKIIALLID